METGQLKSAEAPGLPDPLEMEQRVRRLIVPADEHAVVAGHLLRIPGTGSADTEAEHIRNRISRRLLARRPNADDATWRQLTIDGLSTLPGASCHGRGRTPLNGSYR